MLMMMEISDKTLLFFFNLCLNYFTTKLPQNLMKKTYETFTQSIFYLGIFVTCETCVVSNIC